MVTAPVPAWVAAGLPEEGAPQTSESANPFSVVDYQVRVSDAGFDMFRHTVRQLGNATAVADSSQTTLDFDPSFERLMIHFVRIIRDGTIIDQTLSAQQQLLRRESGLEDGLINGEHTLHLLLKDTRVGDTVDIAYTIQSAPPLERQHFSLRIPTAWGESVRRLRVRLLVPRGRNVDIADRAGLGAPVRQTVANWQETTWFAKGVPALDPEEETPLWQDDYPSLELTEFPDWESLRDWARSLYRVREPGSPALQALVQRFRQLPQEPDRILAALKFVQEEIRYTGIEIGPGAWQPTTPNEVLARRFGDCKDKVLLLVTLLGELGVRADPALVSTYWRRGVESHAPRPGLFDHVIARVQSAGNIYWLDATRVAQGRDLRTLVQADFERALILDREFHGLATIPTIALEKPGMEAYEQYDLSKGLYDPAVLTVQTIYRAEEAESLRLRLRRSTPEEIGREYLKYYRDRYADTSATAPLEIADDEQRNELTLTEHYEVGKTFKAHTATVDEFDLEFYLISDRAVRPARVVRKNPLALTYPSSVLHRVSVTMPDEWPIDRSEERIDGPGVSYLARLWRDGRTIQYEQSFATTRDSVDAEAAGEYRDKIDQIRANAYQGLFQPRESMSLSFDNLSWPILAVLLAGLVIGLGLSWQIWHSAGRPMSTPAAGGPNGLSGWLVLVGIGVVVSPFGIARTLWELRSYLAADVYALVGTQYSSQWPGLWLRAGVLCTHFLLAFLLIASVLNAVQFFARRRTFVLTFVAMQVLEVGASLLGLLVLWQLVGAESEEVRSTFTDLVRSVLSAAIWITYMLVSRRVRATFTRIPLAREARWAGIAR